jgi:hypothetical protein
MISCVIDPRQLLFTALTDAVSLSAGPAEKDLQWKSNDATDYD